MMNNQGPGCDRQNLIKDQQGQEVAGKSNAYGRGETHGKAEKVAALAVFVQGSDIADGVERGRDP